MTNANESTKIPYSAVVKNGKLILNPYLGPEPHQKLISSSDWQAQS